MVTMCDVHVSIVVLAAGLARRFIETCLPPT